MKRERKGSFEYVSSVKAVNKKVRAKLIRNLNAAIRIWQSAILRQMSGQRSGIVYRVPLTKTATYTASAPGEAPAVRSGILRRSYTVRVEPKQLRAYVGSDLDYAFFLERGTTKMKPRPAIEPAFEAAKRQIQAALGAGIKG